MAKGSLRALRRASRLSSIEFCYPGIPIEEFSLFQISFLPQRVSEAGHYKEIATLKSCSEHFDIFNAALQSTIQAFFHPEANLDTQTSVCLVHMCHYHRLN